jgi:hypothetical protein
VKFPNILIAIPSPRDIGLFKEHTDKLKPDRLWIKYHEPYDAYMFMMDYYLQHPEYDYLCILPDDLLVTQKDVDILSEDIRDLMCPVISGYCNMDARRTDLTNICVDKVVDPERTRARHDWLPTDSPLLQGKKPFRVKFSGFPLMMIRNDILNKIPFRIVRGGRFADALFCYDCHLHDIPILVDPRVKMEHLKHALDSRFGENDLNIFTGIKKPYYYLQSNQSNT